MLSVRSSGLYISSFMGPKATQLYKELLDTKSRIQRIEEQLTALPAQNKTKNCFFSFLSLDKTCSIETTQKSLWQEKAVQQKQQTAIEKQLLSVGLQKCIQGFALIVTGGIACYCIYRAKALAEADALEKKGSDLCNQGNALIAKGDELWRERDDFRNQGDDLWKQGDELLKEAEELWREGRALWGQADDLEKTANSNKGQVEALGGWGTSLFKEGNDRWKDAMALRDKASPLFDKGHALFAEGLALKNQGDVLRQEGRALKQEGDSLIYGEEYTLNNEVIC